jgi:mevalonate kinase
MPALFATAPAKTILFGEHAVVFQRPAIAVPISNLRTRVNILANPLGKPDDLLINASGINFKKHFYEITVDHPFRVAINVVTNYFHLDHFPACEIMISSTVPIASGLGSSASTAVALIRALVNFLGQRLDDQIVSDLAFQVEKIHHGNPSGIDNTVIAFEKPIYFVKQNPIETIKVQSSLNLVIGDTGIHSLTKEVVSAVREKWAINKEKYEIIFDGIGEISKSAKTAMESGNIDKIGWLMNENHLLLKQIDVSCLELDKLIDAALKAGALGAKLCGSGRGGNMIALVNERENLQVQDALKTAGAIQTFFTQIRSSK